MAKSAWLITECVYVETLVAFKLQSTLGLDIWCTFFLLSLIVVKKNELMLWSSRWEEYKSYWLNIRCKPLYIGWACVHMRAVSFFFSGTDDEETSDIFIFGNWYWGAILKFLIYSYIIIQSLIWYLKTWQPVNLQSDLRCVMFSTMFIIMLTGCNWFTIHSF